MNKELEALEEIKLGYICGQGAINEFALRENERENFKIIEKALKVLEIIKWYIDFSTFIKQLEKHCDDKTIELLKEVLV